MSFETVTLRCGKCGRCVLINIPLANDDRERKKYAKNAAAIAGWVPTKARNVYQCAPGKHLTPTGRA